MRSTEISQFWGKNAAPVLCVTSSKRRVSSRAATSLSIRCEQSAKQGGGGAGVWLGRAAMVGFASAIAVEVSTGKGFLEVRYCYKHLPSVTSLNLENVMHRESN